MNTFEVGDHVIFIYWIDFDLKLPVLDSEVPVPFGSDSVCCVVTADIVGIDMEAEDDTENTPGSPAEYSVVIRKVNAVAQHDGMYQALRPHVWQHEELKMEEEAKATIWDRTNG